MLRLDYKSLFKPNKSINPQTFLLLCLVWVVGALAVWSSASLEIFPKPMAVLDSWVNLARNTNFFNEMMTSTLLAFESVFWTFVISMFFSYLTVLPFFRPIGQFFTKLRFLSLVGLQFVFMMAMSGGHSLKVGLLTFSMSVFFVTTMLGELEIPRVALTHARTLGMSEWVIVWEVKFLGRLDRALEVLRQNFAMAWMMLTMVEAVSRSEGGIGAMLINQNKHFDMASVAAIQITILIVGILIDYLFGVIRNFLFPYCSLSIKEVK